MNYTIGQKSKQRRDWCMIALIWSNAGLILLAAWLWLSNYTGGC